MPPKVQWASVDPRNGQQVPYAAADNAALEAAFQSKQDTLRLQFGSAVFTVVFNEMRQYNNSGGHRQVMRVSDEPVPTIQLEPLSQELVARASAACRKMDQFVEHVEKQVESDANARMRPLVSPLNDGDIAAVMAVYQHILVDFQHQRFKGKYGFNPANDSPILNIQPNQNVPSYFANVRDQSIFHRKFLSLLGLRNLVLKGVEIFSSMLQQTFSGDQSHYTGQTGPAMMKFYTGNVVDLDSVVLRCSDPAVVALVNANLKKQAADEGKPAPAPFKNGKQLAESRAGKVIAFEGARTLIHDFIVRFKLTPDMLARRNLNLPDTFDQLGEANFPIATDNSQRSKWPIWLYNNVNVLTFHANVPTMSDVYGALLKAPFHFVDAYLTARANDDLDNWAESALDDSCFNHKWRAIEEYNKAQAQVGTIVDCLNQLHKSNSHIFTADFYDRDDEVGTNELAVMKRLVAAAKLVGIDEATRQKRAVTAADVELWHKRLMEASG